nr:V-type ATP synthase alpha chain [Chlamydiota bacterium]
MKTLATGKVVKAFGNLLHIAFEGNIRQGEVAMIDLDGISLKGEVIEIIGDVVKLQVFEDTRGVRFGTHVEFSTHLLEAELGPGLLTSIFDGLQNPLEQIANATGLFLTRGTYLPALDYKRHWDYHPTCQIGDVLCRGEEIG